MTIKESVLWFNCRHAGILPFEGLLQTGADMERAYLVSPFLEYGTVADFIQSHPDVDRCLLVRIPTMSIIPCPYSHSPSPSQIRDVFSAIAFLHGNNIVHGDIKAGNVLVDETGRALLADLGLSRLSDGDLLAWAAIQTTSPSIGTLRWLAPELLKVQQPIAPTTSSDIYALGCFTYEVSSAASCPPCRG